MSEPNERFVGYLTRVDRVEVLAWSSWMSVYESSELPEQFIREARVTYSENLAKVFAHYGISKDDLPRVRVPVLTPEIMLVDEEGGEQDE